MTPKEIIDEARTFLSGTGPAYPVTEALLYHRINARQRQLFALAATWNREYFGQQVDATVDDGCVDLGDLEGTDLWPIESIDLVEVIEAEKDAWPKHTKVTICRGDERLMHDPPRCTIRSHTLAGVSVFESRGERNDLDGVTCVRIWYSRRPRAINGEGKVLVGGTGGKGDRTGARYEVQSVEIGDPWEWLLVWDLVRSIAGRKAQANADKDAPIVMMAKEAEAELEAIFEAHVRGYTYGRESITM